MPSAFSALGAGGGCALVTAEYLSGAGGAVLFSSAAR